MPLLRNKVERCRFENCRCKNEQKFEISVPGNITKIAIFVASEPILVRIDHITPVPSRSRYGVDYFLNSGLNVKCLCKWKNTARILSTEGAKIEVFLLFRKVKIVKIQSQEPEILSLLALDFHEPLSLQHLATATMTTFRLTQKQLQDCFLAVLKRRMLVSGSSLSGSGSNIVLNCSVSKIQKIFLSFNLYGLNQSCALTSLRHDSHKEFLNRLDLEDPQQLSHLRHMLLFPGFFYPRAEKYPELFKSFVKHPLSFMSLLPSRPRHRKRRRKRRIRRRNLRANPLLVQDPDPETTQDAAHGPSSHPQVLAAPGCSKDAPPPHKGRKD